MTIIMWLLPALITGSALVVSLAVGGRAVECGTTFYAMELRACFRISDMRNITINDASSIANITINMEGFLSDPRAICREQNKYMELLHCLMESTAKCVMTEDAMFVPNTTRAVSSIHYLCHNINDTDVDCYTQTYSQVFACVHDLANTVLHNESFRTQICIAADITHDCIQAKVRCDAGTRALLLQVYDVYRRPPGCPDPARSERSRYITTGGSASLQGWIFHVGFVMLLLTLVHV